MSNDSGSNDGGINQLPESAQELVDKVSQNSTTLFWTGIAMAVIGLLAVAFPIVATLSVELLVGWIFIFAGIIGFVGAFSYHGTGPFFGALLLSLLKVVAGVFLLINPAAGVIALTLVVAVLFMIEGAMQLALAFELKPDSGRGWMIFSAVIAILAGILIAANLPGASVFLLGLLVGVNFLCTGIAMIMLSRNKPS
ncbi:MAG: HdeD family acid-resistance protein [Pseudomonadota bacterium]